MIFLVSCASNLQGELVSRFSIATKRGEIGILSAKGDIVSDRPFGRSVTFRQR